LFKVAIQGISLWYFHVYMCYNPNWFISSVFLLSILVFFLWWFHSCYNLIPSFFLKWLILLRLCWWWLQSYLNFQNQIYEITNVQEKMPVLTVIWVGIFHKVYSCQTSML
jgi:hypothetical protein